MAVRPVQVVATAEANEARREGLALVTAAGHRFTGLNRADVVELVRALG